MTSPAATQQNSNHARTLAAAATAAAAAQAAATPAKAAVASLATVTTTAAQAIELIGTRVKAMISAQWRLVNPFDDAAVHAFAAHSAKLMAVAQRQVGAVSSASQAASLNVMGVRVSLTPPHIPVDVRVAQRELTGTHTLPTPTAPPAPRPAVVSQQKVSVTYKGTGGAETVVHLDTQASTTEAVLERPAKVFRYEQSQGATTEQATARAQTRLESVIDDNLSLAQRMAARQALIDAAEQNSKITGYRRVFHPELSKSGHSCGLCIVASDKTYKVEELMSIHTNCNCTVVAAGNFATDLGRELNKADFDQLYGDAREAGSDSTYTYASALKKSRYRIEQHHELGPILVKAEPGAIPQFSYTPPDSLPHPNALVDLDVLV